MSEWHVKNKQNPLIIRLLVIWSKLKKTIEWKSRILFFIHDRLLFGKQAAERLTNLLIKGGWAIEAVAASNATLYTAVSYDMSVKRHFYLYTTHREKKNVMEH